MEVQTFCDAEKYLKKIGFNGGYRVNLDINNIEFFTGKNHEYFISIGEYDNNTFEVFAHSVGAKWNNEGFCVEDGKLYQYKVFKSLKRTIDFAVKSLKDNKLPDNYLKVW